MIKTTHHAPIILFRWFRDGSGIAYPTSLDAETQKMIYAGLDAIRGQPNGSSFQTPLKDGRHLIGEKQEDPHCPDEKARHRFPYVIRATIVESSLDAGVRRQLCEKLQDVPLPLDGGARQGMEMIFETVAPPPDLLVSEELHPTFPWVPLLILLGLLGVWLVFTFDLKTSLAHLGFAFLGVVVAWLGGLLFALPVPLASGAEDLEAEWLKIAKTPGNWRDQSLLSRNLRLVLPDGTVIMPLQDVFRFFEKDNLSCFSLAVTDSKPTLWYRHPGTLLVAGKEWIRQNDRPRRLTQFSRTYGYEHGTWKLLLAQWTWDDSPAEETFKMQR